MKRDISKGFQVAGLALVVGLSLSFSARAETLADALASAYEHSGLLQQNRALLRAADEDVAIAVSGLRPIISWTSDVTRSFGRNRNSTGSTSPESTDVNLGITGQLLLYDFGRTRLQIESQKELVLATRQGLISVEQQVLFRAVQAYMNVRRNTEVVAIRQNNLRLLGEELRAAKDRFEVGEVTRTDVAQAEARLANARSGLALAQGDLTQAVEEFRAAIGRRPGNLIPPSRLPRLSGDVEAAKGVAVRRHPDMLQAQHNVAVADLNIAVAKAATRPTVNLAARLNAGEEIGGSNYSRNGTVGVEISGPIYQGGRLSAATRQAMAQRDAQRGALHEVRHTVKQNVGNAYANLRAAQAAAIAGEEGVRAATVAFRGVREEAKLGARTTLDVLDTEQELLDARANLISAQVDVYIAAYGVLAATGELTAKDLNLGVKTYDPTAYYNLVKDAPVNNSKQGKKLDKVLRALGKN
ncbi:TolC family outer membrane protein [uncultured Roseovarius sp.]|uniref:TolC family outer membrane protein n=1 Tax=uncultured Roseovarius sp. TaxID=293344 RepID=UPI002604796C|nr:TolC family outer membrane protein [uncultured Roseovarius sp.]